MKQWVKNIVVATSLGVIGGEGQVNRAEQPVPPPAPHVTTLDDTGDITQPVTPVTPPTPEAVHAGDELWKAIVASSTWDYSQLFDSTILSVGVQIDAAKLQAEMVDRKLSMQDIADGYKAMTNCHLTDVAIDGRTPSISDMQTVATQVEAYFKQFRDIKPVAKKAGPFCTLKAGEEKPRFLMSIPRQPTTVSCESGIDRLFHWCALKQTVESLGGDVIILDPKRPRATAADDGYESLEIFTRDPVIVLDDRKIALAPDFAAMEKEGRGMHADPHVPAMIAELQRQGYTIKSYKGHVQGGDVIYDRQRKLILVGLDMAGFDVNRYFTAEDAAEMERLTDCKVLRIKRTAYSFYHLDTAIAPLPGGKYLINPVVTDHITYQDLKTRIGEKNIIEIPREEKRYFSNLIAIGDTLVMPACSATLEQRLNEEGFKVITPEKTGLPAGAWDIELGSVHCMTQQVMRNIKRGDEEAYASIVSSPAFHDTWEEKADPAKGKSFHRQITDQDIPYYRHKQAESDVLASREPRSKC